MLESSGKQELLLRKTPTKLACEQPCWKYIFLISDSCGRTQSIVGDATHGQMTLE